MVLRSDHEQQTKDEKWKKLLQKEGTTSKRTTPSKMPTKRGKRIRGGEIAHNHGEVEQEILGNSREQGRRPESRNVPQTPEEV